MNWGLAWFLIFCGEFKRAKNTSSEERGIYKFEYFWGGSWLWSNPMVSSGSLPVLGIDEAFSFSLMTESFLRSIFCLHHSAETLIDSFLAVSIVLDRAYRGVDIQGARLGRRPSAPFVYRPSYLNI